MKKSGFVMESLPKRKSLKFFTLSVSVMTVLLASAGLADLRKAKVGDAMPEFSLPDSTGAAFAYKHGSGKVVVLTFLPTIQKRYERVIADIQAVVENIPEHAGAFAFAGIISGSAGQDLVKSHQPGAKLGFTIVLDTEYHLWGTLGVIAAPTVLIVGNAHPPQSAPASTVAV